MARYFLEISYKGTNYSGWQIQINGISVQQKVNEALSVYLSENIETLGCGRTDTGVHALQFFLHFDTSKELGDGKKLCFHLNGILPNDISVHQLIPVMSDVSARFDAKSRSYQYVLYNGKNPFLRELATFYPYKVDVDLMNEACKILKTFTDFECFSKVHTQVKTFECKIGEAKWGSNKDMIYFEITADRFLRGMVRAITGTMLRLNEKRISIDDFKSIIESKDRRKAGHSVAPQGLYLAHIAYDFIPDVKRELFL